MIVIKKDECYSVNSIIHYLLYLHQWFAKFFFCLWASSSFCLKYHLLWTTLLNSLLCTSWKALAISNSLADISSQILLLVIIHYGGGFFSETQQQKTMCFVYFLNLYSEAFWNSLLFMYSQIFLLFWETDILKHIFGLACLLCRQSALGVEFQNSDVWVVIDFFFVLTFI